MKKALSLLILVVLLLAFSDVGCICADDLDSWDKPPLTGNGPTDMLAIAWKNDNKSRADLGIVTSQWCAAFVSDLAILAGQTAAIPGNIGAGALYDNVIKTGLGTPVDQSEIQAGDLIFYGNSRDDI